MRFLIFFLISNFPQRFFTLKQLPREKYPALRSTSRVLRRHLGEKTVQITHAVKSKNTQPTYFLRQDADSD